MTTIRISVEQSICFEGIEGDARGVVAEKPPAALAVRWTRCFGGESRRAKMSPLEQIRRWTQAGWFRPLDLALTEFYSVIRPVRGGDDRVLYVAALASVQLGRGHVCVDLSLMQGAVT